MFLAGSPLLSRTWSVKSDEDFEPVESEDKVVTRNIEIARNLQKTQTDMVKQVGKTQREGDYQIGNWVSLDKEPRAGLSKMDAVRYGRFKVVGCNIT